MGHRPSADLFYGVAWEPEAGPTRWEKESEASYKQQEADDEWDDEELPWEDDPVNALAVAIEEHDLEDLLEAHDHGSDENPGLFICVKGTRFHSDWDSITTVGALPPVDPEGLKALQQMIDYFGEDNTTIGWLLVSSYG